MHGWNKAARRLMTSGDTVDRAYTYDFGWDQDGDAGAVWVVHRGLEVCVEAMERFNGEPTGKYTLASEVDGRSCLLFQSDGPEELAAIRAAEACGKRVAFTEDHSDRLSRAGITHELLK